MPAILFVCTANQCRSPIAAATFRMELAGKQNESTWRVASAGTWTKTGLKISNSAARIARKAGVDLSSHLTTSIVDARPHSYDLIAVMDDGHKEALVVEYPELTGRIHLLTELAGLEPYEILDPLQYDSEMAVEIALDVQDCVRRMIQMMVH